MSRLLFLPFFALLGYLALSPVGDQLDANIRQAISVGKLSSGVPIRRTYTGLPSIDGVLSFLVCVFYEQVDWSSNDRSMFTLYFLGAGFMPMLPLMQVEAERARARGKISSYPLPWQALMQAIGFLTVGPIYFMLSPSQPMNLSPRGISTNKAAALVPALALGYVLPTAAMLFGVGKIDVESYQAVIVLWNLFPFTFWIAYKLALLVGPGASSITKKDSDYDYLRKVYNFCILISAGIHLAMAKHILESGDLTRALSNFFLPALTDKSGVAESSFNMLKWDFAIGVSAALVWTGRCVWQAVERRTVGNAVALAVLLAVGSVLISPGATMAAAFKWREGEWQEEEEAAASKKGE